MKELAKEHNCDFEQHHEDILNFVGAKNTAALNSQETAFNEHMNRVPENH